VPGYNDNLTHANLEKYRVADCSGARKNVAKTPMAGVLKPCGNTYQECLRSWLPSRVSHLSKAASHGFLRRAGTTPSLRRESRQHAKPNAIAATLATHKSLTTSSVTSDSLSGFILTPKNVSNKPTNIQNRAKYKHRAYAQSIKKWRVRKKTTFANKNLRNHHRVIKKWETRRASFPLFLGDEKKL